MRLLLALLSLTLADVAAERRSVPTYTIDLDLPPEERFKVLVRPGTGLNATVWKFWTKYFVGDPLLKDALFALVAARGDEAPELQAEISGMAAASGLPPAFVQGIQMLYEVQTLMVPIVNFSQPRLSSDGIGWEGANRTFHEPLPKKWEGLGRFPRAPFCTGIIATNQADGSVYHARNLDFFFTELMAELVYTGVFTRGGKELYRAQMIAGYAGMITGMRRGPDGYALERNTRYADHWGGNKEMLAHLLSGRLLNGWVLRQTLEACATYACAVGRLTSSPYASTEYAVISGVRKGTILARNPDGVAHTQTLGRHNYLQPPEYILVTNFDFFFHDVRELFDPTGGHILGTPRRVAAQRILNATLQAGGNLTGELLFDTLNAKDVLADTIFQAIINVERDLWNVSIPDPASLPHATRSSREVTAAV
mmetsp:Transcript_35644/g.109302  ORF Transcript_35644/g.109302 Transcript_35644/m.109302 type:complete len:424 (-) Transcript_35644:84-1355(-)